MIVKPACFRNESTLCHVLENAKYRYGIDRFYLSVFKIASPIVEDRNADVVSN